MDEQTLSPASAFDVLAPGLSASQRRILELLKRQGGCSISVLSADLGLNVETVRHHLRVQESFGYVRRSSAARADRRNGVRGRPEIVFALSDSGERLFPRREGPVLRALAVHLKETGNETLLEQFFESWVGAQRAHALARVEGLSGEARLQEVARILTELGFMASAESGRDRPRLHLCNCPLSDLVEVSTVPCRAELGLIRELLGESLTRMAYIPSGDASCSYRTRAG